MSARSFTDAPTVLNQAGKLALHTVLVYSVLTLNHIHQQIHITSLQNLLKFLRHLHV